jgi:hypothetical protein
MERNMVASDLIRQISEKNADIGAFVHLTLVDSNMRMEIVRLMVTHSDIMVYYHCYYVVDQASSQNPGVFYEYWDELVPLLRHPNSYHRDIALTILANLTAVDAGNRFVLIADEYLSHLWDAKFMTAQCFVRNCLKSARNKPELADRIIQQLLDMESRTTFPAKQKELLKADVLAVLECLRQDGREFQGADEFIRSCTESISPKTRKMAKKMSRYTV